MKQELSNEQKEIVLFNDCEGALLVQASAGSGKTRILTERVRHLLTKKKDKFFSILCLTFTNKAADEMKERLNNVPKWSQRAFIGTFHEFCLNQIIRKQRQEIGLEAVPHIFDEDDKKKIIETIVLESPNLRQQYEFAHLYGKDKINKQKELIAKYINFISDAKRKLIIVPDSVTEWADWNEKDTFLYKNYNYSLENQNAMDYDDILLYAYRILSERPNIAKLYKRIYSYILVDEAQDLNFAQYHILKAICSTTHKNVMLVGDPKQAIYAFNGASVDFMQKEFVADFEATQLEIPHNYRSSEQVLKLAQFIRPNGGLPNSFFEGICEIKAFENEHQEAQWIIEQLKIWLKKGFYEEKEVKIPISLMDIAILTRNRYIFKTLMAQLDADEIFKNQYYLRKGTERFAPESQIIKLFDLGLRILVNPADILHFNQLYQTIGLTANGSKNRLETLLTLNQNISLSEISRKWLDLLVELWAKLEKNPKWMDVALETLCHKMDLFDFSDEEKLKMDYDISEFQKLWKAFLKNTPADSQQLANFRYFLALNSIEDNKKGLTLATIHTVKGLEYEIVFLMGMNEGVLPDFRAKDKNTLAEERNNAYVAVTRAKKCIYISYPKSKEMPWGGTKPQSISQFIKNYNS
jgi:DNA helicase II / ATP-dependent DNA helicase PcrA